MNRPLRRVAAACGVLMVVLLLNLNFLQVIKANDYRTDPRNSRVLLEEYDRERGAILVGNEPIAISKATNDVLKYLRTYLDPQIYAFATGYYSHIYGSTGVERYQNSILAGTDDRLFVKRVVELLTQEASKGGDVKLTLNKDNRIEQVESRMGNTTTVTTYEEYGDWNGADYLSDVMFPKRIVQKRGTMTIADLTITKTNTYNPYVIMPVPASVSGAR